ncbi:hypothetical protein CHS0354_017351 [Potamilus streckersoni]|uniref:Uncharacterized protein n=1 Tax=Potamilus streckersoni TaxID=2493646 RepID=A0AAE0W7U4_9BIVA|nr:hypothetical protein CHS0354_017351 [Potamilus streckersoni]
MSRKEEDVLNYKKIERYPHQKISIRKEIIDSAERSEQFVKRSNKTMSRERALEAIHKISDGRPMPVTLCETEAIDYSSDGSSHSIKKEDMSFEMSFNNDEALTAMTLLDLYQQQKEPQKEPLDLSNKTLLRKVQRPKEFSMLESYNSAERSERIFSDSDKSLKTVQTATSTESIFGTSKLRLFYEARSKTNPYPVTIPYKVNIPGIGLVPGIFVPGFPARICKTDNCLEISLTDPSELKDEDQPFFYSASTNVTTALGHEGYQHLAISATTSLPAITQPNPDGSHLYIPSSSFNSGQAIIPLTSSDCYETARPSTADISQLSSNNRTVRPFAESSKPLTPDCRQPERTDIDVHISRCTEPLCAASSEQHSLISHSEEESQLPVAMDTGNSICLPNIPCLQDNVNEWIQTEHEAVKKRLKKKIRGRTEAPD